MRRTGWVRHPDGSCRGKARRIAAAATDAGPAGLGDRPGALSRRAVQELKRRVAGEPVGAFVLGMAGMALHPVPLDPVRRGGVEQFLPQLGILDRLLRRRLPAVAAPAVDPLGDAVADIDAVGGEDHLAGALQRLQRADRGEQLHAVVGGHRLAAGKFLLVRAGADHGAPPAGAGIALAGAVGEDFNGYHAIEFLLWGQDHYADGAGKRSHEDYLSAPNAKRRALYLNVVAELLVSDLASLEKEWRKGQNNYRKEFEETKATLTLKKILSGIIFMAGDELSGERMYVAYDTQGQEDEHSCFSDTTHLDIQWNYWGVENVIKATNLLSLPGVAGTKVAERIQERLKSLRLLLASIPVPFDQAIVQDEGRSLILTSLEELEALARDLTEVSKILNAQVDY